MNNEIPFNKSFIAGQELYNIAKAVMHGHLSGNGPYTQKCQFWLESKLGCSKALLTHSCTAALELAALLCDVKPGDEIIMPSYTFVSTANAFVLRGGVPVFVDIRADTLNIDERQITKAVSKKSKAIVPVHYAGVPCAMDTILSIAEENGLYVIEDAAQGLLADFNGQYLGTIGHLGAFSFHETKNIISGEGGALLINSLDLIDRAEILWEKGTNRKQFFQGRVDKYTWVDIGSSFLPGELISAFLWAQLEEAEKIIARRCWIFNKYLKMLAPLEEKGLIKTPWVGQNCKNNGHIFYIIANTPEQRTKLLNYLRKNDIHAVFHYIPLHNSPAGRKYGKVSGKMTNSDKISAQLLRLPMYYEMSAQEIDKIVAFIYKFFQFNS